jgi:hypothetical protein
MADVIPFLRVHRFQDHDGQWQTVEVRADIADLLEATEARLKERTCTDAGLDPNAVVNGHLPDGTFVGFAWEGPRFQFGHIIGESRIWNGPPEPGEFCGWAELEPGQYCLCCQRSGKDPAIPRVTRSDVERRKEPEQRRAYVKGKYKGGVG